MCQMVGEITCTAVETWGEESDSAAECAEQGPDKYSCQGKSTGERSLVGRRAEQMVGEITCTAVETWGEESDSAAECVEQGQEKYSCQGKSTVERWTFDRERTSDSTSLSQTHPHVRPIDVESVFAMQPAQQTA